MQLIREDKPASLRNYRVFTLRDDDSTLRVTVLNATSVDDAIDQARHMVGDHPVELWVEQHMIARFAPVEP